MENNAKKRSKKAKGFTLVELIAVIAILGILAMVIVPKVSNYTTKARTSAVQADARTVLNAIEAFNAENQESQIAITDNTTAVKDLAPTGEGADDLKATIKKISSGVKDLQVGQLDAAAKGTTPETPKSGS